MNDFLEMDRERPMKFGLFSDDDLDLSKYWKVIRRRKWAILVLALLVTLLVTMIVFSLTPFYKATSTLLIEPERRNSLSIESLYDVNNQSKEYYYTQLEVLKSRRLAEKVIVELALDKNPEFVAKKDVSPGYFSFMKKWFTFNYPAEVKNNNAVDKHLLFGFISKIQGGLTTSLIKGTQLIKITYTSESPSLAAGVSNALARVYIEDLISSRIEKTQLATDWMEQRLRVLKGSLKKSEQVMQVYKERHGLIDVRGVNALTADELSKLTSKLLSDRTKYNEISKVYGPKHPKLISARSELQEAERELKISELNIQKISRRAVELRELQRQVDSNRTLYDTFLNRLKEATQSIELQDVNARIVDYAEEPRSPFKPRKSMIIILAFFASLMFGIFLTFLHNVLDKTFKNIEDIENKLNVPILGILPLVKENKENRKEQVYAMLDSKQTIFAESMRTIRTGLVLSSLDNPHKVILVTSSVPGEGKTIVATNLAIAMAKMEKVLLIGGDLRRPTLSRAVDLHEHQLGVSSIVAGTADFKDCIKHLDVAGIDVLPCGQVPPNPLELLSSERFGNMITVLEKHYDRIVIDSPPLQAVSDSLVLSKYAKAVVYVIEADSTHEHAVKNGLGRLLKHGAPIAGVILNKYDVLEGAKYDYSSGGYYDLYGYSESKT